MKGRGVAPDEIAIVCVKNTQATFLIVCVLVAIFNDWGFGYYWPLVWLICSAVISVCVAFFAVVMWFAFENRLRTIGRILDVVILIAPIPASYFLLKFAHGWMNT